MLILAINSSHFVVRLKTIDAVIYEHEKQKCLIKVGDIALIKVSSIIVYNLKTARFTIFLDFLSSFYNNHTFPNRMF